MAYRWSGKKEVLRYVPSIEKDGLVVLYHRADGSGQPCEDARVKLSVDRAPQPIRHLRTIAMVLPRASWKCTSPFVLVLQRHTKCKIVCEKTKLRECNKQENNALHI